ncbi:uncharacterized protein [Asterias amurensis]|uniref:uncharacterized protein n=1 Tax=Asterias amurensis TaxID=7602 RepID=UPI003AB4BB02
MADACCSAEACAEVNMDMHTVIPAGLNQICWTRSEVKKKTSVQNESSVLFSDPKAYGEWTEYRSRSGFSTNDEAMMHLLAVHSTDIGIDDSGRKECKICSFDKPLRNGHNSLQGLISDKFKTSVHCDPLQSTTCEVEPSNSLTSHDSLTGQLSTSQNSHQHGDIDTISNSTLTLASQDEDSSSSLHIQPFHGSDDQPKENNINREISPILDGQNSQVPAFDSTKLPVQKRNCALREVHQNIKESCSFNGKIRRPIHTWCKQQKWSLRSRVEIIHGSKQSLVCKHCCYRSTRPVFLRHHYLWSHPRMISDLDIILGRRKFVQSKKCTTNLLNTKRSSNTSEEGPRMLKPEEGPGMLMPEEGPSMLEPIIPKGIPESLVAIEHENEVSKGTTVELFTDGSSCKPEGLSLSESHPEDASKQEYKVSLDSTELSGKGEKSKEPESGKEPEPESGKEPEPQIASPLVLSQPPAEKCTTHDRLEEKAKGRKTFQCKYCVCRFLYRQGLWRHTKKSHSDEYDNSQAGAKSQVTNSDEPPHSSPKSKTHNHTRSEPKPLREYQCPHCVCRFRYRQGLWRHTKTSHREIYDKSPAGAKLNLSEVSLGQGNSTKGTGLCSEPSQIQVLDSPSKRTKHRRTSGKPVNRVPSDVTDSSVPPKPSVKSKPHKRGKPKPLREYQCPHCVYRFRYRQGLWRHTKQIHSPKTPSCQTPTQNKLEVSADVTEENEGLDIKTKMSVEKGATKEDTTIPSQSPISSSPDTHFFSGDETEECPLGRSKMSLDTAGLPVEEDLTRTVPHDPPQPTPKCKPHKRTQGKPKPLRKYQCPHCFHWYRFRQNLWRHVKQNHNPVTPSCQTPAHINLEVPFDVAEPSVENSKRDTNKRSKRDTKTRRASRTTVNIPTSPPKKKTGKRSATERVNKIFQCPHCVHWFLFRQSYLRHLKNIHSQEQSLPQTAKQYEVVDINTEVSTEEGTTTEDTTIHSQSHVSLTADIPFFGSKETEKSPLETAGLQDVENLSQTVPFVLPQLSPKIKPNKHSKGVEKSKRDTKTRRASCTTVNIPTPPPKKKTGKRSATERVNKIFQCPHCVHWFPFRQSYLRHLKNIHGQEQSLPQTAKQYEVVDINTEVSTEEGTTTEDTTIHSQSHVSLTADIPFFGSKETEKSPLETAGLQDVENLSRTVPFVHPQSSPKVKPNKHSKGVEKSKRDTKTSRKRDTKRRRASHTTATNIPNPTPTKKTRKTKKRSATEQVKKRFQCPYCVHWFPFRQSFWRHVKNIHSQERSLPPTTATKEFGVIDIKTETSGEEDATKEDITTHSQSPVSSTPDTCTPSVDRVKTEEYPLGQSLQQSASQVFVKLERLDFLESCKLSDEEADEVLSPTTEQTSTAQSSGRPTSPLHFASHALLKHELDVTVEITKLSCQETDRLMSLSTIPNIPAQPSTNLRKTCKGTTIGTSKVSEQIASKYFSKASSNRNKSPKVHCVPVSVHNSQTLSRRREHKGWKLRPFLSKRKKIFSRTEGQCNVQIIKCPHCEQPRYKFWSSLWRHIKQKHGITLSRSQMAIKRESTNEGNDLMAKSSSSVSHAPASTSQQKEQSKGKRFLKHKRSKYLCPKCPNSYSHRPSLFRHVSEKHVKAQCFLDETSQQGPDVSVEIIQTSGEEFNNSAVISTITTIPSLDSLQEVREDAPKEDSLLTQEEVPMEIAEFSCQGHSSYISVVPVPSSGTWPHCEVANGLAQSLTETTIESLDVSLKMQ